jgi:DNA-binding NtrC family response regulator
VKGFEARVAYSGEEAIIVAEEYRPHAVISDVILGKMTGLELALYLEAQQPNCKVLLMSGYASGLHLIDDSIRLGYFHTVLMKPVHPAQILAFVGTCAPHLSEP